ncbi:ferritin-like domain-containing protein [Bradyrhizobium sp. U87765 SZCCT0134]|uniref:ferritin-like domain-containing protein n=1 Tax=Bradyrhizobium sp. U87765 SZCCT0134 TaxID=2807660 RepID=UPI0032E475BE
MRPSGSSAPSCPCLPCRAAGAAFRQSQFSSSAQPPSQDCRTFGPLCTNHVFRSWRVRKIGGTTRRSLGHSKRTQRMIDNDADFVGSQEMLAELRDDNIRLTANMRETRELRDQNQDVATASLLNNWIDEAERRACFLFEATQAGARR